MKLETWHSTEDKSRWKIVRTDDYTEVSGEIVSADEETGKYTVKIGDDFKSDDLGPRGLRLVGRGR
jgi:hypothetical protein